MRCPASRTGLGSQMDTREAACHCGQLRLEVTGDPFFVSICHCLACQRRTGSAFGMQAAFRPDQVQVTGRFGDYTRISDEADRKEHAFHFCPECGSQVFYTEPTEPDLIVVSVGSFADPSFPPPTESGYHFRRHHWLTCPTRSDGPARSSGTRYDRCSRRGTTRRRRSAGASCSRPTPSKASCSTTPPAARASPGRPPTRSRTFARAIEIWDGCRELARSDSDFDPIREEPGFAGLISG